MIPKILHYCWFGGNKLPQSVERCISSWKRLLPEFEIKRWDESNFDIELYSFAAEAYRLKKYAFVADVCRVHVLEAEGGVYVDTDMLFVQGLDSTFLENEVFLGWESNNHAAAGIVGSVPHSLVISQLCEYYKAATFPQHNLQELYKCTIPVIIMEVLSAHGVKPGGMFVNIENLVTIYPKTVFYAKDNITGYTYLTDSTIAIHLYDASWVSDHEKLEHHKYQLLMRLKQSVNDLKQYFTTEEIIQNFRHDVGLSSSSLLSILIKRVFTKNLQRRKK